MTTQLSLLDTDAPEDKRDDGLVTPRHLNHAVSGKTGLQEIESVPGLKFMEDFLTPEEQALCVERVDSAEGEWRYDLRRRVQHYGWRYDYKARAITPDMEIGALPDWLSELAKKLYDETNGLFDRPPEQVIVNEYEPGQGIAMHVDHKGFGPTVCTISLLDDWEMDFSERRDKAPALLKRGSCVLLTGQSRSDWQHGIAPRKSEALVSGRRQRKRRLSLTFRTVLNRDGMND